MVNDEYQTKHFWNMKKSELKNIIKEEIRNILENEDPINIGMKKAVGFKEPTGPSKNKIVSAPEKEYKVEYFYRHGKYGDESDYGMAKIMATTEEEALKKAQKDGHKYNIPKYAQDFKIVS